MNRRMLQVMLFVGCAFLVSLLPARAYDDDTHFYYCYYLARKCGFSQEDAKRIASANVSVDYCEATEPLQKQGLDNPIWNVGMQQVREHFHALLFHRPTSLTDALKGDRPDALKREQAMLHLREEQAWKTGNPGMLLHFYMDMFAHRDTTPGDPFGYYSALGHSLQRTSENGNPLVPNLAIAGHKPDYLSNDVAKAMRMTKGVIWILTQFKANKRMTEPGDDAFSMALIEHDANFPHHTTQDPAFKDMRKTQLAAFKVLDALVKANQPAEILGDGPNSVKARQAIQDMIRSDNSFDKDEVVPLIQKVPGNLYEFTGGYSYKFRFEPNDHDDVIVTGDEAARWPLSR